MDDIRTERRKLFEERLAFADRYMVYHSKCRDQERRVHAIADVHTHLTDFYSISPRIGFWSAQGGCGKSMATEISYFFVQNPMFERNSGAGLLREIHKQMQEDETNLPTILFDEVQNTLNPKIGNNTVADMLACYSKGPRRTIWDDGKAISMDLFCPVFTNGLTTKFELPANYLERNIPLPLERPLPGDRRAKDMWLFDILRQDLETDDECKTRNPWVYWAQRIDRDTMKEDQDKVIQHLRTKIDNPRHLQLCLPLAQTAYYIGDEYYAAVIDDVIWLLCNQEVKYTEAEQILSDCRDVIGDQSNVKDRWFLPTANALNALNAMEERPWKFYKGNGLTAERLAILLGKWDIKPEYDGTKAARGYHVASFIAPWQRALSHDKPEWMKECY